jgi:hypothetical protein
VTDLSDRLRAAEAPREPLPALDELWARGLRRRAAAAPARAVASTASLVLVVLGPRAAGSGPRVVLAPAAPPPAEVVERPYYRLTPPRNVAIMEGPRLSDRQREEVGPTYRSRHGSDGGIHRVRLARRLADVVVYAGPGDPGDDEVCIYVVPDRGSICQPNSQPMALVEPDPEAGVVDVIG